MGLINVTPDVILFILLIDFGHLVMVEHNFFLKITAIYYSTKPDIYFERRNVPVYLNNIHLNLCRHRKIRNVSR